LFPCVPQSTCPLSLDTVWGLPSSAFATVTLPPLYMLTPYAVFSLIVPPRSRSVPPAHAHAACAVLEGAASCNHLAVAVHAPAA